MDHSLGERRRDARFGDASVVGMRATLRPGCLVSVVDLSAGGALVEAPRPLRPGASVHLRVATARRTVAVAAHILRCAVWAVDPHHGVRYRGALRFDQPFDLLREHPTRAGSEVPEDEAGCGSRHGKRLPGDPASVPSARQENTK